MSDSWLPPPPDGRHERQRRAREKASAAGELPPELEARIKRVRWYLLLVPYSFPMWMRLRAESPAAAARLRFELAVCIFNTVLGTLLGCCLIATLVARQQIVDALVPIVLDTGLVK